MSLSHTRVPSPHTLHPDTLANGNRFLSVETGEGELLVCYCPLHLTGALFVPQSHFWQLWTPCSFAQFLVALACLGIAIPAHDDARIWFEACSLTGAGSTLARAN